MALTAYTRLRMLWGAYDWQHGTDNPYTAAQTASGGASAVASGGVGVRRAILNIDRATTHPGADPAQIHFDFLNMTAGAPDDTWTTADYTTLEAILATFVGSVLIYWPPGYKYTMVNWYREGDGVTRPNPAVRQLVLATPQVGVGSTIKSPPQVASSLTFRTAVRRSWGRTYIPIPTLPMQSTQVIGSGDVDIIAAAGALMVSQAAAADFHLVVVSKPLHATLNVERIECDDNADIVRRRRWKSSTYKKLLP